MKNLPEILVIDDEPIVHDALMALLERDYSLHIAEDGIRGLEMAKTLQPDLILLDVMMPGLNGFDVCEQIRATPDLAEVPIIMITALDGREARLRGLNAGVDDFVSKPFDSIELLARVQTITRLNRYRRLVEQRRELLLSYEKTIEGWSKALDLRDEETEGHTLRVTETCMEFARAVGIPEEEIDHIRRGALLHDVGKLGVPDSILLKPGKLTEEEWVHMRRHPDYAHDWLKEIPFLEKALAIPWCHHEKWDGTGYPRKLAGRDIPLFARLFSIVDVWDALRSSRPYRAAMPDDAVCEYLRQQAGKHFDPDLVDVFINLKHPEMQSMVQVGEST